MKYTAVILFAACMASTVHAGEIVDVARCEVQAAMDHRDRKVRDAAKKQCYNLLPANIRKELYRARNDDQSNDVVIHLEVEVRCGPRSVTVVPSGSVVCERGLGTNVVPRGR